MYSCDTTKGGRGISSFDTDVDLIGRKPGYGEGTYVLHDVAEGLSFGPDFDAILGYLDARRGNRTYVRKADISPAAFKDYLPRMSFLTPVWGPDGTLADAVITLHGSEVAAAYTDNTGKKVTEVHTPGVTARVLASMQKAAELKRGVIGVSDEHFGPPPHVRLHILYVPVALDGETLSHFFAYVRFDPIA